MHYHPSNLSTSPNDGMSFISLWLQVTNHQPLALTLMAIDPGTQTTRLLYKGEPTSLSLATELE